MLAGRWDKRRKKRKPKHQPAWISCGPQRPTIPCMLCDLSEEGARLAPARFKAVPDAFTLVLSKDGSLRRPCRVVWRKKLHIGVQFIAPAQTTPDAVQPGAAAQARGGTSAPAPEIFPAHLYRPHRVRSKERKEVTISALAGMLMWLLIIAAAIFYVAGMQLGDEAPWALALCDDARNFCQHPEWSGIPAALMALVYFSLRGMEV
jgi:hypothetical protein